MHRPVCHAMRYQHGSKWDEAAGRMIEASRHVEDGGADFIVLCTNTMHRVASEIEKRSQIPLLHIADATAEKIRGQGLKRR